MIQAMSDDFFARLIAVHPRLSTKMAQLATFVSENYARVAFMTTRELAAASGVSLATVIRFPAVLGYADFEQFRASIQARVNYDLAGVERLRTLPPSSGTASALLRRVIEAEIEDLHALAQTFSEADFERFVAALLAAERVVILGFRYIAPLASYFGYSLRKICPDVQTFVQSDSSLYDELQRMSTRDVLIVIAFVPYLADLLALVRYAHQRNIRVLAITDSPLSSVLPLADVALMVRTEMLDFVGSLAAPAALIHCIVSQVAVHLGDTARERLQALAQAAEGAGLYDRTGRRSRPFDKHLYPWEEQDTPNDPAQDGPPAPPAGTLAETPDADNDG